MTTETSDKLRETVRTIRIKPYPIKDLIPLLLEAADKIDELDDMYWDALAGVHGR